MKKLWCKLFHKRHHCIFPYVERDEQGVRHQRVAEQLKCYKCGCWIGGSK